jgi:dienelactone hydrolase
MVLHGIKDSRTGMATYVPMFQQRAYAVLLPDSRAQRLSGGEYLTYGLLEKSDVIAWAHWLKQNGCEKVYGLGESLGASILIQAAAAEPAFSAIVAESPYSDLKTIAQYRVILMSRLPLWIASPLAAGIVNTSMVYAKLRYGLNL